MQKVAVVTGASYGLGKVIAQKLLNLDYKVYGISRTKPQYDNDNFIWLKADLLVDKQLSDIGVEIPEQKLDLLVNSVGTAFLKKTLDYSDVDFDKMFSLNFRVHAKITKLLFTRLKSGLILNISSLSDRYPEPDWGLYGSSKTALNLFFETMAAEEPSVKIINLLPSYVETPLQHKLSDGTDFDWNLCMQPEGVAYAVEYVLTHLDQFKTGSRVIIEKEVAADDNYRPEKLWTYDATTNKMTVICT